jgi:diguanylate cyclase (GGDEF)-like protein
MEPALTVQPYNQEMPGSARITLTVGFVLVVAAWVAGSFGLPAEHRTAAEILTAALAVPLVLLAGRFRRHRAAVAGVLIAGAEWTATTAVHRAPDGTTLPLLCIVLALTIALLSVTRDRPLGSAPALAWLTVTGLLLWAAAAGPAPRSDPLGAVVSSSWTPPAAFAVAAGVVLVSFSLRRGAFGAGLIWVVAGCAAALLPWRGPHPATLLFAAAQLSILTALFEEAYRLAYHDELTGLPGRRALDEALRGLGGSFVIAMVDIDHFKRFNDRHGHDAGDQVLRMVADELGRVGGGGRAHRYGGEEFAILFPNGDPAAVRGHLEHLRAAIADRSFALRGPDRPRSKPEKPRTRSPAAKRVTVHVSIGFAGTMPRRSTPRAVLKAADRALYRAKRAGRNRVVGAGDRLPKRG